MKKKKIICLVSVLLVCALVFGIFWIATEDERYIKKELRNIQTQVDKFRAGERDYVDFSCYDIIGTDPRTEELLITLVKEMCENREKDLLLKFLTRVEFEDFYSPELAATLKENLGVSGDLEFVFGVLDSYEFDSKLEYYNRDIVLNRDTGLLAAYIEEHGTQTFTAVPGEGYYANEKDTYDKDIVGLPTSPLYDVEQVVYMGDFKCIYRHGVKLNSYYEETSYSNASYLFRDNYITFGPDAGELVWSGEYMLCFDAAGNLTAFCKI